MNPLLYLYNNHKLLLAIYHGPGFVLNTLHIVLISHYSLQERSELGPTAIPTLKTIKKRTRKLSNLPRSLI